MDEARHSITDSSGTPSSTSGVLGHDLGKDELTHYTDYDNGDDWDLASVPVESQVNIQASIRRNFNDVHEMGC